ncbi:MAG TPA: glycoside hydrolase family 15 protein [Steroidobacteraceae bacterium]|nr:glycoside hydrolase family 15 protein [Steroidobacteraceae bacterium]
MRSALQGWIGAQARFATSRLLRAISATDLVMERRGFGQRVIPAPGSVLASPVIAHYDPDPDYFFHWFRDSALVIDALRVAIEAGYADAGASVRFEEFIEFSLGLQSLDGGELVRHAEWRSRVQPAFLQYLRPAAELAALSGSAIPADARVNPDGTLDVIRWGRPQADGPAMRALTLLRWWRQFPALWEQLTRRASAASLIHLDLQLTRAQLQRPCSGIWEEALGHHYYTELLQSEALSRGAEWLESTGGAALARTVALEAERVRAALERFWDPARGFCRSTASDSPGDTDRDLDMSALLAVLHAGRRAGPHSVLDPRAQATLAALEELFEARYAINRHRPADRGPAMGRYASDRYYSGGAWYIATLGAAEFYFQLALALRNGASLADSRENATFRQRLGATAADEALAHRALERGDAFMRTVRAFTPESGELSEQFDQTTGVQTSAKHLSWSYAAFITAAASRALACQAIRSADPPMMAADAD